MRKHNAAYTRLVSLGWSMVEEQPARRMIVMCKHEGGSLKYKTIINGNVLNRRIEQ